MSPLTLSKLIPRGPFSLAAAATFGFGPTEGRLDQFDGAMTVPPSPRSVGTIR